MAIGSGLESTLRPCCGAASWGWGRSILGIGSVKSRSGNTGGEFGFEATLTGVAVLVTRFGTGATTLASGEVGGGIGTFDLTILTTGGGVKIALGVRILTGTGIGTAAIIGLTIFGVGGRNSDNVLI